MTPSAETIGRAIVAAAMLLGQDPTTAFDAARPGRAKGPRAVRILAGHGLRARLGTSPAVLAPLLKIVPTELAPSQRQKYGITTDQLLVVSEALGDRADDGRPARDRFLEPWSGTPTTAAPQPRSPAAPQPRSPAASAWGAPA